MRVLSHRVGPDGLTLRTDAGLVALTPRTSRTVRVRFTVEDAFSQKPSLTVIPLDGQAPTVAFAVVEDSERIILSTAALTVEVARETAALTYRTADGTLLTREPDRGGKSLAPVEVLRSEFGEATVHESRENVDGVRIDVDGLRQVPDRIAYHTKLEFCWADGEALYGLGSHEEGMFNLRGQHQYLYQENLKVAVPVIVSTRGYGVFLDCTSLVNFHDDAFGSYLWGDVDEELDYYFMLGPSFDEVVAEFRALTGPVPMLPRWAFGYVQSKERYESQQDLLAVAHEYRRRGLPLDCIVLDWKSWSGDAWGQKTLDPATVPRSARDDAGASCARRAGDGVDLAHHAPRRRRLARARGQGPAAGQSGDLRRLRRRRPRHILAPGGPWPLLARHRCLVVGLHRAVRGRLDRRHQARARRAHADQHRTRPSDISIRS